MTITIADKFWSSRLELNRTQALIYQWEQYNACGTLENFRLVIEKKHSHRRGFFYTDSDLHKWADAVSRTLASRSDSKLEELLDEYIALMEKAQDGEGYLYTWNQIYFPGIRWKNIHVEHELYTAGHFIEAGISHYLATGNKRLLNMAIKMADLILRDFKRITFSNCPGHQEIEIALLRLYRVTGEKKYMDTAEQFLRIRGTGKFFGLHLFINFVSHRHRSKMTKKKDGNEGLKELGFDISENVQSRESGFLALRSFLAFISGSYQQQDKPFLKQTTPRGHSVRWTYMMYAATILAVEKNDKEIGCLLSKNWENLAGKKMYITGGIGSLPIIEGFGKNHELNNELSYSETCAAIGSIFWNNEMLELNPLARYADLVERQLYNAASVGISQDGKKYFYRNPLESHGEIERHSWFQTACCPSNISRLWADIYKLIYTETDKAVYINQYIGNSARFDGKDMDIRIKSEFPWEGQVEIRISSRVPGIINLRIPGWAQSWRIRLDGEILHEELVSGNLNRLYTDIAESGEYMELKIEPGTDHLIELEIPMEIMINCSDKRVKNNRGKIAISRGPLIYCIESEKEIDQAVDTSSLRFYDDDQSSDGKSIYLSDGKTSLIPYFLWGNHGKKKMKVWVEESK